jgi:NAD(P)H-nitrite reductase large subunit
MNDDVIVCRCEEVTLGEVRRAIREGAIDVHGVKLHTRAGMGLC